MNPRDPMLPIVGQVEHDNTVHRMTRRLERIRTELKSVSRLLAGVCEPNDHVLSAITEIEAAREQLP